MHEISTSGLSRRGDISWMRPPKKLRPLQTPDTSVLFAIAASAQPLPVNASVREPRRR